VIKLQDILLQKLRRLNTSELIEVCNRLHTCCNGYKNKEDIINHINRTFEQLKIFSKCERLPSVKQYECYSRCLTFEEIIQTYRHISSLSEKNRIQTELIKKTNLSAREWIEKYAEKFSSLYESGEFDTTIIEKQIY